MKTEFQNLLQEYYSVQDSCLLGERILKNPNPARDFLDKNLLSIKELKELENIFINRSLLMVGSLGLMYFYRAHKIYSIPCKEGVNQIQKFAGKSPILEIMGGCGYLSKWLHNSICTDNFKSHGTDKAHHWIDIIKMDAAEAVEKYSADHVILLSWPPYDNGEDDYNAICKMKSGQKLIYIGESSGGCTGSNEFHDELSSNFEFQNIKTTWYSPFGIHDRLNFYIKK